jgi:AcrR family transcriptional regulator
VDAAARVVARKGFAGASIDDIAGEAGFTTGALYANFASKDELFVEMLSSRGRDRLAESTDIVSGHAQSVEDTKAGLNKLLSNVADGDADLAPLQAEFWVYAAGRPDLQGHLAAQFRSNRDSLSTTLARRAATRGQPEDAPFDDVATVLLALFQGLVQLRRTDPDLVSEDLYGTAAGWLMTGMNRQAGHGT